VCLFTSDVILAEFFLCFSLFSGGESDKYADYLFFRASKLAYEGRNISFWVISHCWVHLKCRFMTPEGRDFLQTTAKRFMVMDEDVRVEPRLRLRMQTSLMMWYTPIHPEYPKQALPKLLELTELIAGNQKLLSDQVAAIFVTALCAKSMGNMQLFESCTDTFHGLRCDTEARVCDVILVACYRYQFAAQYSFCANDSNGVHANWVEVQGLAAKYPKVSTQNIPSPFVRLSFMCWLSNLALDDNDYASAGGHLKLAMNPMLVMGVFGSGIFVSF